MESLDPESALQSGSVGQGEPRNAHEAREINEVVERLAARFPQERPDRIREVVDAAHQRFEGSPIRDFVPVFVERAAKDVLARPATG